MTWVRNGDEGGMHPIVLAAAIEGDKRLVNELYGFVARCAALAAVQSSYRVTFGQAHLVGLTRAKVLLEKAVKYGYMTVVDAVDDEWEIVQIHGLIHIKTKEEKEWDARRKRDNRNPKLLVPVRSRDGDNCRYCMRPVSWKNRNGALAATYDHVHNAPADSPDDMVVACFECNREPNDRPPLQPPPDKPRLGADTKNYLAKWSKRYPSDPAPSGTTPTKTPRQRPAGTAENAANNTDVVRPPTHGDNASQARPQPRARGPNGQGLPDLGLSGRVGTGRDGTGQVGTGRDGTGRVVPGVADAARRPPSSPRKRSKRGRGESRG